MFSATLGAGLAHRLLVKEAEVPLVPPVGLFVRVSVGQSVALVGSVGQIVRLPWGPKGTVLGDMVR